MQREPEVFLEDIIEAAVKIESFTSEMSFEEFENNELVVDAVIKNILVIGEATKNIPNQIRIDNPQIEWRKMVGMRDVIIHGYFSINYHIVWDIIQKKIPVLKQQIKNISLE